MNEAKTRNAITISHDSAKDQRAVLVVCARTGAEVQWTRRRVCYTLNPVFACLPLVQHQQKLPPRQLLWLPKCHESLSNHCPGRATGHPILYGTDITHMGPVHAYWASGSLGLEVLFCTKRSYVVPFLLKFHHVRYLGSYCVLRHACHRAIAIEILDCWGSCWEGNWWRWASPKFEDQSAF